MLPKDNIFLNSSLYLPQQMSNENHQREPASGEDSSVFLVSFTFIRCWGCNNPGCELFTGHSHVVRDFQRHYPVDVEPDIRDQPGRIDGDMMAR